MDSLLIDTPIHDVSMTDVTNYATYHTSQSGHTSKKRRILTTEGKKMLRDELRNAERENAKMDRAKVRQQKSILQYTIDALKENVRALATENRMLAETSEKYKNLYYNTTMNQGTGVTNW